MPIQVLMPALSPTMEEGKLAKWLKKEGDTVKSGDIIAEIETDKATMEVEAVDEGTLAKLLVDEGTEAVKVNTPIAVIATDGEDVAEAAKAAPAAPAAPVPATEAVPHPRPLPTRERGGIRRLRPRPCSRAQPPPIPRCPRAQRWWT